jgi:phage gpG-like protein
MGNSFEQVIRVSINNYSRGRAALPKRLGNEAVNHFKDNWRKQGFDNTTVQPWKSRKGGKDPGRAILVKTGRLRRSFNMIVQSISRVFVENDAPYGIHHNYGTKKMPQRKFMGKSQNLDEKSGVLIMRMIKAALR